MVSILALRSKVGISALPSFFKHYRQGFNLSHCTWTHSDAQTSQSINVNHLTLFITCNENVFFFFFFFLNHLLWSIFHFNRLHFYRLQFLRGASEGSFHVLLQLLVLFDLLWALQLCCTSVFLCLYPHICPCLTVFEVGPAEWANILKSYVSVMTLHG